jgi:hypothetical protein
MLWSDAVWAGPRPGRYQGLLTAKRSPATRWDKPSVEVVENRSMAGRSSSAIWFWLWPSRVRRPASVMMIWKTPASAIPRSLAISGATASVSARAVAWRSDISRASRWTIGLIAAGVPRLRLLWPACHARRGGVSRAAGYAG